MESKQNSTEPSKLFNIVKWDSWLTLRIVGCQISCLGGERPTIDNFEILMRVFKLDWPSRNLVGTLGICMEGSALLRVFQLFASSSG